MTEIMSSPKSSHHAFTITYSRIVRELHTPAVVSSYYSPSNFINIKNAIWDTGATGTGINILLGKKLNLEPIGRNTVRGAHGKKEVEIYAINIQLDNTIFKKIAVAGLDLGDKTDIIIGMDIITLGDFAISNAHGKTTFTYVVPPFNEKIDFVEKVADIN